MEVGEEGGVTLLRYGPCPASSPAHHTASSAISRGKEKLLTRLRRRSRSAPRNRTKSERDKEDTQRGANGNSGNHRDSIIYEANGERVKNSEGGSRRRARPESVELVGFSTTSAALSIPNLHQYSHTRRAGNVPTTNKTSAELKEERKQRNMEMNGAGAAGRRATSHQFGERNNSNNNNNNSNSNGANVIYSRQLPDFPSSGESLKSSIKLSASSDLLAAERDRLVAQNRHLLQQAAVFGRSSDIVNQFLREREERFRRLTCGGIGGGGGMMFPHHGGAESYTGAGGGGGTLLPPPGYASVGGGPECGGGDTGAFLRGSSESNVCVYPDTRSITVVTSHPSAGQGLDSRLAASCESRLDAAASGPAADLQQCVKYTSKQYEVCDQEPGGGRSTPPRQVIRPPPPGGDAQVIRPGDPGSATGDAKVRQPAPSSSEQPTQVKTRERIIPIQVIDEPMLPPRRTIPEADQQQLQQQLQQQQQQYKQQHHHPTHNPDLSSQPASHQQQQQQPFDLTTGFPSIFNDLKLSDRHPLFEHGRLSANIPAAFGRFSSNLGDDISALRSGIRDSFFGMQSNFGKFPTFGPILPEDSLNLSPHTRRNGAAAHKKRLQKRQQQQQQGVGSGQKPVFRYVTSGDQDDDDDVAAVNSETESEDEMEEEEMEEEDDLDSVSVVARTRDRLSGTGSTQSEDSHHSSSGADSSVASGGGCSNSSTLSNDSGIAEEFHHHHAVGGGAGGSVSGADTSAATSVITTTTSSSCVPTRRQNASKAARPISAVPSELSDVSNLSNLSLASSLASRTEDEAAKLEEEEQQHAAVSTAATPPGGKTDAASAAASATVTPPSEDKTAGQKKSHKPYLIAKELLSTEIHYVSKLHLIDQVFHFRLDQENRNLNIVPQETIQTMFSNIKSIYKFHAEFLLPQLQERMEEWRKSLEPPSEQNSNHETDPCLQDKAAGKDKPVADRQRIGDIMLRYSPFLIMYTEYVKNFDTAMRTINSLYTKNSKFAAIMDSIHGMEECENLSLQHHMLCPIQRIPRYEMLLRDYLTNLSPDSPDRSDSENALKQVSQAAAHANDSMKRIEQFKKLLETQESIGGSLDLVSPTRELIKEGRIVKISARTGDHQDRYLFLLTDLLLLCSPRKSMISGAQYGLRAKFHVENLQVSEGDNLVTANTFYLRDETKSVELYTSTQEEKEDWIQALFYAINSLYTRKSSLRVGRDILRPLESEIGKKKPHLQKLDTAVKCAECGAQFSLLKPKHNCRTCGAVFCGKCCDYKHSLSWEEGRKGRVCKSCHNLLTNQIQPDQSQTIVQRPRGLLEVPAFTAAPIQSGWLTLKPPGHKSTKRFFLLLSDFVLYSFKGETDPVALTATPLPGYLVATGSSELRADTQVTDADRTVRLQHPSRINKKRANYFVAENSNDALRWAEMMRLAAKAELPQTYKDDIQSEDRKSTSSTEYENS